MQRTFCLLALCSLLLLTTQRSHADEIDDIVRTAMQRRNIPGVSLAVVRDGTVIKSSGYGVANVELNAAVAPETVFPMASVSKQFIAAGIMLLIEEGKVDLDGKLSSYLAETPDAWKEITVRHLLTHTSGMVRDDTLGPRVAPTEQEMFRAVAAQKLNAAP